MSHHDYFVAHGLSNTIERFSAEVPLELRRGARVVVQSDRGLELGEVSCRASARQPAAGQLLRAARAEDLAAARSMAARAEAVMARGDNLVLSLRLPVALLDVEVLLAGDQGTFAYVQWGKGDIRELVAPLSREFDLSLTLEDLSAEQVDHGCGSCGEGGCGSCGSGGCGTCGGASMEEVREYFAGLRKQMERRRISLL
jgi:cell fate regulator YaaT (PSP1 superfamily)